MAGKTKVVKSAASNVTKNVTDFDKKVYEFCSKIPKGKVTTYKELAKAIGSPKAFRAVGSALRHNPYAPQVPCHRVVASNRTLGGFYGSTDKHGPLLRKKVDMLKDEGVEFEEEDKESTKVSTTAIFTF